MGQAYQRSYERLGNDPVVGRRLVALLVEAGAVPQRNSLVFLGSCAGEPHFGHYIDNLIGVIDGARATVVDATLLDATAFDAAILVSCPGSSLAFGRRCIPPGGGVARCSHIGQYARASRLANRAPRRPWCTPNFQDATLALRDWQRGPSATLWYTVCVGGRATPRLTRSGSSWGARHRVEVAPIARIDIACRIAPAS